MLLRKSFILFLYTLSSAIALSCSIFKDDSVGDQTADDQVPYFNEAYRGKWENLTDEHIPQCSVKMSKDEKIIKVTIPFEGTDNPPHYVETILLLDHNRKELEQVTFAPNTKKPKATFVLPRTYRSFVYVVEKCNLHDMWEYKVLWDEPQR